MMYFTQGHNFMLSILREVHVVFYFHIIFTWDSPMIILAEQGQKIGFYFGNNPIG